MHLFVDNLVNVDFSYLHPQRGLVGETWLASVVLAGDLDEQGMVCDFGIVKKTLRKWLDETIDHCLLVPYYSDRLETTTEQNRTQLSWRYGPVNSVAIQSNSKQAGQHITCHSPQSAITLIEAEQISAESVAQWCIKELRTLLPNSIGSIALRFEPENIQQHYYHYSHGLKKHGGNCQRIAHGHRSTIEIYRDDQRDTQLEKTWCEHWQDIYIGTRADLIETLTLEGNHYYAFSYQSSQGDFSLRIPTSHCYLIDTDSTVEYIAQHIAQELKAQSPAHQFTVKAFEGIGKGAICRSG